jgi:hypothetical protein
MIIQAGHPFATEPTSTRGSLEVRYIYLRAMR